MKKIYFSFLTATIYFSQITSAQDVQWLNSTPVNYNLNPEMPQQPACVSGNKIYAAQLVDFALDFGSDILGSMSIDCYDSGGALLWSFPVGQKMAVKSIIADATGNVFVGGTYMETLHLDGTDSLVNTGSGFDSNLFLFSLDAAGNLQWKRNVSLSHPDAFNLSALAMDPQGNGWYALEYFDSTAIKKLDVNGNDMQSYLIEGTRSMGSFSFDPAGNMFITGSSGSMIMNVNGFSLNVPEPYMMFVTRINAAGNCSWIQLVHDVTFQSPQIVATPDGHAFVSGNLMDSASFGSVVFEGPQWVYDIFLTKVDSTGNFSWGVEVPETNTITGDFQRGKNNFIDVDAAGNLYLAGTIRGIVDWGNGVISDAGPIPSNGITVISFDGAGTPRWQLTGGATGFVIPYSVCVAGPDECYFATSAVGTATFDSLTTNQGGGYAFILGKIYSGTSSGIHDLSQTGMLSVFPNPASEQLSVNSYQLSGTAFADELSIYNALGEMVSVVELSNLIPQRLRQAFGGRGMTIGTETIVDVRTLSPGIYFLELGNLRAKFIVQRD